MLPYQGLVKVSLQTLGVTIRKMYIFIKIVAGGIERLRFSLPKAGTYRFSNICNLNCTPTPDTEFRD